MRLGRAVAWPVAAVLLLGAVIAARATVGEGGTGGVRLVVRTPPDDSLARVVELRGLDDDALRTLGRHAGDARAWAAAFALHVDADAPAGEPRPAVLARYEVHDDHVRLVPRWPLTPGVAYRVHVDHAALAAMAGEPSPADPGAGVVERFVVPERVHARTTRVVAIHPSLPTIPENQLRWYVELSASMEPGGALEHVRLLDEAGREVDGAFLALEEELWDAARRRLTLLFDPGRVKRGIRTNLESGAPLVAGRRYRLVIDDEWRDGRGAMLASGFEHEFQAGVADRTTPDPARWRIAVPAAGTREPLRVAFGEPMDHALAARMIVVREAAGGAVAGRGTLAAGDSAWSFVPEAPWAARDFTLVVDAALEDLAGNSVARPFDADRARGDPSAESAAAAGAERRVPFVVRARPVEVRAGG